MSHQMKGVAAEPCSEKRQLKMWVLLSASSVHAATCLAKQVRNMSGQKLHTLARGECMSATCRKLKRSLRFVAITDSESRKVCISVFLLFISETRTLHFLSF